MRSTILALAGAGMAAAQQTFNNGTHTATKAVSSPAQVGAFHYLGCFDSSTGSPSFHVQSTNPRMNADLCAASCPTELMALDGNNCLCGDSIDEVVTKRLSDAQCNTPCGGNPSQACGGTSKAAPLSRREYIGNNLSVFIRGPGKHGECHEDKCKAVDKYQCPTGQCDKYCPNGRCDAVEFEVCETGHCGQSLCPNDACDQSWFEQEIVCYGDYCAPQFPCKDCDKFRVICRGDICYPEKCESDEDAYKLVICEGDDCRYNQCQGDDCFRKVVCYQGVCAPQECYGNECQKKLVCEADYCFQDQCYDDEECYSKIVCQGPECQTQAACVGQGCAVPLAPLYPECLDYQCPVAGTSVTSVTPVAPVTPVVPIVPIVPTKPVVPAVDTSFKAEIKPVQAAGSAWSAPAMAVSILGAGLALLI